MSILESQNDLVGPNTAPPIDQFDEAEFLGWAKKELQKAKNDRTPLERQWYLNLSFFMGKQWVQWTDMENFEFARLREPPKSPHTVRLTSNKIRPRILKMLFKLNQEKPRGYVQPNTTDSGDIAGARAAEAIYDYVVTQECKQFKIMREADLWALQCGTSYIKIYYDANTNKIRMDAMSPFHVFVPDLEVQDIEDQPWVAHISIRGVDDIEREYGYRPEGTSSANSGSILNDRFLQGVGIRQNTAKNATIFSEIWIKPNSKYPQGIKVCWVKDKVLDMVPGEGIPPEEPPTIEVPNPMDPKAPPISIPDPSVDPASLDPGTASPFIGGMYPFVRRIYEPAGRFYGESPITDLIPLQMQYNRRFSQIIENANISANQQLVAPKGSLNTTKLDNTPGLVIEYNPGMNPPTPLKMQDMPSYVQLAVQMTQADLDEVSSMGDINRGDAPGRVEAAAAISYLQEENDSVLTLSVWDKEDAIEKLGNQLLELVQIHWDSQRQISVTGTNQAFEAFLFSGEDLKGQTNYKVVPGSGQPMSRAARQAFIVELMNNQMITVPQGLKRLEMGDAAKLHEEMRVDNAQAERENLQLSKMEPVPVKPYDNDIVHVQVHDDFCKTQEFENMGDQEKSAVRMHIYQQLYQMCQKSGMLMSVDPMLLQNAANEIEMAAAQGMPPQPNMELEFEMRRIMSLLVANNGLPPMPTAPPTGGQAPPA